MISEVPGRIVVLNGAPRSGKSSIAAALQASEDRVWLNLGVDAMVREITPARLRPGIGLRPGEHRDDLTPLLPTLYAALYDSVAACSRLGLDVVVDVGHHDPVILAACARRIEALPAWFVGVRCPIEVIMERRNAGQPGREGTYATGTPEDPIPAPVQRWQDAVHDPGIYDLEVDTSQLSPEQAAARILAHIEGGLPPSAVARLAART